MAKLKAYNRTEIFRMEKEEETPDSDSISRRKLTIALMSDNKILEKFDVKFRADNFGSGSKHSYGWKVRGNLKEGGSPDALKTLYLKRGFVLVS